jgi:hypothetical protein
MRFRAAGYLTLALTAACASTPGRARVASLPHDSSCPPIGLDTDTAGVVGRYYTAARVATKAAPEYETRRQALAPGLELTSIRGPHHPGVNGEALVAFVVDTSGRVDFDTFTVEKSTAPEITNAIRQWLPSQRFTPATLDGCAVRQLVFMPFAFSGSGGK